MPRWFIYLQAAQILGVPVYELADRPDAEMWIGFAFAQREYQTWFDKQTSKR